MNQFYDLLPCGSVAELSYPVMSPSCLYLPSAVSQCLVTTSVAVRSFRHMMTTGSGMTPVYVECLIVGHTQAPTGHVGI